MNELLEFLKVSGFFAGGLLLRALLLILVVALYAIPILLAWGVYRAYQRAMGWQAGMEPLDGLLLAGERHYAPGHAWLLPRPFGRIRIGLDDIGQRILPGATAISLPRIGMEVKKGEPVVVVASGHRETAIPSPIDGKIVAVNHAVRRRLGLLNRSPYDRGWLFAIRPAGRQWAGLPTGGAARDWFRAEEQRFGRFMEHELGMAAADGGDLVVPGPAALSRAKWEQLVSEFLKA